VVNTPVSYLGDHGLESRREDPLFSQGSLFTWMLEFHLEIRRDLFVPFLFECIVIVI